MGYWAVDKKSVHPDKGQLLMSGALRSTIIRNFPSVEDALKQLDGKNVSGVAFSHRFWVDQDRKLYYRNIPDPTGSVEHDVPVLDNNYRYLEEALEEDM
jgi:hypothetical protein